MLQLNLNNFRTRPVQLFFIIIVGENCIPKICKACEICKVCEICKACENIQIYKIMSAAFGTSTAIFVLITVITCFHLSRTTRNDPEINENNYETVNESYETGTADYLQVCT